MLNLKPFIKPLVSFDNSDYSNSPTLESIFMVEYGYHLQRLGKTKAIKEWCMGLPTCLDFPFYNSDIVKGLGFNVEKITDEQVEDIIEAYWYSLAFVVADMMTEQNKQIA